MASNATKDGKSKDTVKPIHALALNDTSQTTEEWKAFVIQEIGKVSGELSSILKSDKKMPTVKSTRPKEPVKPTSDLMALMIDCLQDQYPLQPRPSALDVWENYSEVKRIWDDELAVHLSEVKLITQDLAKANMNCFATLEPLISESLVDTIRKTSDGEKAYSTNNTLRMIELAMEFAEFQSPESSTNIVETCKLKYDTYKQPSGASMSTYIGKKKRLHDEYVKARGAPVQDFEIAEIRKALLKGVTDKEVNLQVVARKNSGILNTILDPESVASMLLGIEGELNRDHLASGIEGDLRTAHRTNDERKPLPPKKCDECGPKFSPYLASHMRCDSCQKKVSAAGTTTGVAPKAAKADTKPSAPGQQAKTSRRGQASKPKPRVSLATDVGSDDVGDQPDLVGTDLSDR